MAIPILVRARARPIVREDRANEAVMIRWRLGAIFTEIARSSHFSTRIANKVIWTLRSRYAIALLLC